MKSLLKIFQKISKGDQGELEVAESITKLLKGKNSESNFFIIPKMQLEDFSTNKEVDLVLLHPVYGIFIIEVKNHATFDFIDESDSNPFEQAKGYRNLLLAKIEDALGKIPVNVEFRVFFPSLTYADAKEFFLNHASLQAYKVNSFFKDDLESKDNFKRFFKSANTVLPNKKEFLQVASLLIDKEKIKDAEDKILPIICNDEILFFDHKQLSVLNGYTGGFRIIRGVAGTGKTVILSHFINNKLNRDPDEKFLILCFNNKLANNLSEILHSNKHKSNIHIVSIFAFLSEINFDYTVCSLSEKSSLDDKFEAFETDEAIEEFRLKARQYLKTHPIDYMLCDETQDMPEAFMRILYEEIKDCIFFIDEAQKFYNYSMDSIAEVFHHKKFEKLSMQGRVKNLKNVYRTPSNIAKCAFEVLSHDTKINSYYRKSHYLQKNFLDDINFVLEDGNITTGNWNDFNDLKELLKKQHEETIVLTYSKKQRDAIDKLIKDIKKETIISAMTIQSIKGLEAQNIIIHNFDAFLNTSYKYNKNIFYRQIYVVITRAQRNLYLSIDETKIDKEEILDMLNIFKQYEKNNTNLVESDEDEIPKLSKLTKLKPPTDQIKSAGEFVVLGAELFAVIGGLFA